MAISLSKRRQTWSHLPTIMESLKEEESAREKEKYFMATDLEPALTCFVLAEDNHIFHHPLLFEKEAVKFHVYKSNAFSCDDELRFIVSGPGKAVVTVCETNQGLEKCEIIPPIPGNYNLDIILNGEHIDGSPYLLVFKAPNEGLNLHTVNYRLGVVHRFEVCCSTLAERKLKVTISPSSAAMIGVSSPVSSNSDSYKCTILPLQVGVYKVSVTNSGKHIYGSPFNVHFNPAGDASKCILTPNSSQHEIGNRVSFNVATDGAGYGELVAEVDDVVKNIPIDIHMTRTLTGDYTLEFDPGSSSECCLTVKYDNAHVCGSPFKLVFKQAVSCTVEGAGLISAQAGVWNVFRVKAKVEGVCDGSLKVDVNKADGERVETVVSMRTPLHFDISYLPKTPGVHSISVYWGDVQVQGSPFLVICYPASYVIVDQPTSDVTLGICVHFKVRPVCDVKRTSYDVLRVSARDASGREIVGYTTWQEESASYSCSLIPDKPGKYPINVKLNNIHVMGSPFVVTVINYSDPHLVDVYGCGLSGMPVGEEGNLSIDVSRAGAGWLSVLVRDRSDIFKLQTSSKQNGFVEVSYTCTAIGTYLMDVTWSGKHVPGSPFPILIDTQDAKRCKKESEFQLQDKHDMFLDNVTGVGINGEWLKVWRTSSRFRRRHTTHGYLSRKKSLTGDVEVDIE